MLVFSTVLFVNPLVETSGDKINYRGWNLGVESTHYELEIIWVHSKKRKQISKYFILIVCNMYRGTAQPANKQLITPIFTVIFR